MMGRFKLHPLHGYLFCLLLALVVRPLHAQTIEELVNIDFIPDIRLFTVMAAINVAGFDYERSAHAMSQVRRQVRQELARLDPNLVDRLRRFYATRKGDGDDHSEQSRYVSFALWLQGPPRFELSSEAHAVPSEVQELIGFEPLLEEFFRAARIEKLWEKFKPYYLSEIERYRPLIRETIIETLDYLRCPARVALDRKLIFMPDLLNAHGLAHARNIGGTYYLVVSPARNPEENKDAIRHEYLHFLVDPLIEKYGSIIVNKSSLQRVVEERPRLEEKFRGDFFLVVTESLLRAIELRLKAVGGLGEQMREDYDRGLILVFHFYDALGDYGNKGLEFTEYFPELLKSIDVKAEMARAQRMSQRAAN